MNEDQKIINRLLNVLPPNSVELSTFFRIFDVKLTNEVPTACITCSAEPLLLINPEFVNKHCKTDEHLFMLVMHEIYHIILGHTRLFPHPTPQLNIIFDAVINAMLCNMFPSEAYTSFFTSFYRPDEMPYALLRPVGPGTPAEAVSALDLLYGNSKHFATYHDIFLALQDIKFESTLVSLLGSHGGNQDSNDVDYKGKIFGAVSEITSHWPDCGIVKKGQSGGGSECVSNVAEVVVDKEIRKNINRLMSNCDVRNLNGSCYWRVSESLPAEAVAFCPTLNDRTYYAKKLIYGQQLLYKSFVQLDALSLRYQSTYVYLDVSGSVQGYLPQIFGALKRRITSGQCKVYAFSTKVVPLISKDVRQNKVTTTGGTDIRCVMEHLMALPASARPHKVVLLTDGYTGSPSRAQVYFVKKHHIEVYCGLLESSCCPATMNKLKCIVKQFVTIHLP